MDVIAVTLAQAASAASEAIAPVVPHFHDPAQWMPARVDLLNAARALGVVLILGALTLRILKPWLAKLELTGAYVVLFAASAIYAGLGALQPDRLRDPTDLIAVWIHRLFVAALIYVLLRAVDRFILIPLLSRRGRVPVQRFVRQLVLTAVVLITVFSYGAWAFGWDIDKFLAGSAVVSIVLGLALQETLGSFFSGLAMQGSSPYQIGDWISCGDLEGCVTDMTWRAVTLHTSEDNYVLIPNGMIAKEVIINYSAPTRATARDISVGLEYDLPPNEAINLLAAAAAETEGVLADPPPMVHLQDYASSSINYRVKFWIGDPSRHPQIENAVRVNAWYRLRRAGFDMPFQTQTVELINLERKRKRETEKAVTRRIQLMESVWLFSPLSAGQRRAIAENAVELQLAPGQEAFHQGDPGESFFIIERGGVDVLVSSDGRAPTKVASLKAGDFFGEMSALTGQPRTATIRAATGLCCMEVGKKALQDVFASDPAMLEKVSRIIAERDAQRHAAAADTMAVSPQRIEAEQGTMLKRMVRFFGLEEVVRARSGLGT